ncbi:MAG: OadG family protein [Clostridiales bacterium]|nr:OadG family protein [Clostridiales bacterium]MDO4350260.1 OadG family protein [Eubacteriales bacterium]MDY4009112.1 OadG family protein [Candidatus Limiplasma sp.]
MDGLFDASAAAGTAAQGNAGLAGLSLLKQGLITTVIGLAGVFLVLTLFYITIKLMQRIHTKDEG